jgi:cytoskeleton protein RodZ
MSDQREPQGVGARLKARREERRMTLAQIAAITKISKSFLDSIERDDIKRLPGGIFLRAFVRAYASELGLDPEPVVSDFLAQFPDLENQPVPRAEVYIEPPARSLMTPLLQRVAAIGVPVLAVVVLAVWWVAGARARHTEPLAAERIAATATEIPAPSAAPADAVVRAGGARGTAAPAVSLAVTANAQCWLSATIDGQPTMTRLVSPGEQIALTADRELVLKIGDATAVTIRLNGEPMRTLGAAGEVVTVRLDRANLQDFLARP